MSLAIHESLSLGRTALSTFDVPDVMILTPTLSIEGESSEYSRALDWLLSFANYEVVPPNDYRASKFNLDRMRVLLGRLGDPQQKFASIHVAGTKGKGSTAAICESILRAAGIKTGLYTSPHLHTFRERIRIDGELAPREAVVSGIERLKAIQPELPGITVFELMTALAFDLFAESGVELAVVEVGIGGRLDSTNVITPRVSVLTSISFDHTAILGSTLPQIASEKAGIIKTGIPAVSAPQVEEVLKVFENAALERGAPLTLVGRDWIGKLSYRTAGYQDFRVTSQNAVHPFDQQFRLHLLGAHQLENATTAIAATHILSESGFSLTGDAIREGVSSARWPGRFEILECTPLVIADGAHNRDSARRLVETLDTNWPKARLQWIFGASSDKDLQGMFDELLARAPDVIVTRAAHPRAAKPADLARMVPQGGIPSVITESVAEALALAQSRSTEFDATVITGSLFVVAQAREIILRHRGETIETDE